MTKGKQDMSKDDEGVVTVAFVDDDPGPGKLVARHLKKIRCKVDLYRDPAVCLAALTETPVEILITDLRMPGMDGLELLQKIKEQSPATEVIIATGAADKDAAIRAVRLGAFDLFEKPINADELIASVKRTIRYETAVKDRDRFASQLAFISEREAKQWGIDAFVGRSRAMTDVIGEIRLLQKNDSASVLVLGESGTGKELVARAIHSGGGRSDRPFVPINCSAIPDNLAESQLFGHVKGAFTGASSDKKGAFELAHEGTLFLDEIGDMLPTIQAKLLRVLEDGMVERVGATKGIAVDIRIVAATNADLPAKIQAGDFRTDLFHRLSTFTIALPPLRERQEDIPLLVQHFAEALSVEMGLAYGGVSRKVLDVFRAYAFPGNVRELRNMVECALIRSEGRPLEPHHVQLPGHAAVGGGGAARAPEVAADDMPLNLKEVEKIAVRRAMAAADGNVSAAARMLGIGRTKLYRMLSAKGDPNAETG